MEEDHYYPFGLTVGVGQTGQGNLPAQPYKYNGKELEKSFGLEYYYYGARQYDPQRGQWTGVDPLADKYYGTSPFDYTLNNPVKYIDPDGKVVVTANNLAQQAILNTLTKEDRTYISFNNEGVLNKDVLNGANSTSGNFGALKQLVNDERTFEFNITDKITYKDENGKLLEKSMGPIEVTDDKDGSFGTNTGEEGWRGATQTPGNEADKNNSPDNTIKIVVNSGLGEEGRAQTTAHEAYGHAYLYSKGEKYAHDIKSTEDGLKETNTNLADKIRKAVSETIQNMKDAKENK